jgi:hypothetical protein
MAGLRGGAADQLLAGGELMFWQKGDYRQRHIPQDR